MDYFFFFSSRRRHTRSLRDWSSDVCSSDLDPSSSRATRSSSITCCSIAPPPSPTCRGCATRSRAGSSRPPSIRAARRRSWCDGCLLPRAGHVEDARAGVPEADALDRADDRRPEAPELEGGLVLDVEEGAHVAEV